MRVALLLALISASALAEGRFERFCSRGPQGRSERGFGCADVTDPYAFFEFAPTSGAGMGSRTCTTNWLSKLAIKNGGTREVNKISV